MILRLTNYRKLQKIILAKYLILLRKILHNQIRKWVARQFSTGTKFGSKKRKVQKPARIPPQTPPAGGKSAEAGQIQNPRKIVCPAESKLVFRIFVKKCSNFVQKTPPKFECILDLVQYKPPKL